MPLAAFFAFVGWHKTVDPLADLLRHGAWTAHVPRVIGRFVGGSELICAVALFAALVPQASRWTRMAAFYLAANQVVSSIVHVAHDESRSLPQNLLLAILLLLLARLVRVAADGREMESK